jgi:integrase
MENEKIWEKFHMHCLNEGLSSIRVRKLFVMFKMLTRFIDIPIAECQRPEIESFINKLNLNQLKKKNGDNFSGSTKQDAKKFLKQFFKWYKGDNEYYPKQVSWIKCRISKEEMPIEKQVASLKEIIQLANSYDNIQHKMLTLLLFDSGFRISEMMSVKKCKMTWEEFTPGEKCWFIECAQSKTFPRKVEIPLFTEEIAAFVNSSYFRSLNDDEPVFSVTIPAFRKALRRRSGSVISKALVPHALRHSSATYYAVVYNGDLFMLCDRYGWSYDSDEPKTYVRRSGRRQKIGAKLVYDNELVKLREDHEKLKEIVLGLLREAHQPIPISRQSTHDRGEH